MLRISDQEEKAGMDNFEHGGAAYHIPGEVEMTQEITTA
jgi:ammonia channel protein AmtB